MRQAIGAVRGEDLSRCRPESYSLRPDDALESPIRAARSDLPYRRYNVTLVTPRAPAIASPVAPDLAA